MKKVIALLLMVGLLAACGSGKELDSFVDDYNQSARKYDVTTIEESEFQDKEYVKDFAEEEDDEERAKMYAESDESTQVLFLTNDYEISVVYDSNKLIGYGVTISSDGISKDDKGFQTILTVADALELDVSKIEKEIEKNFGDNHEYEDGDYKISMNSHQITDSYLSVYFYKND